jgi:hypothetical protein
LQGESLTAQAGGCRYPVEGRYGLAARDDRAKRGSWK